MVELERILTGKLGFEPKRRQGVEELLLDPCGTDGPSA
jgi:hypothetical protein